MTKSIHIATISSLSLLLFGLLLAPSNPIFWLASSSISFMYVRMIFIFVIGLLLIAGIPSSKKFRLLLGLFGTALIIWSGYHTYTESLAFLDGLSLMLVGISFTIFSLEPSEYSYFNWRIVSGNTSINLLHLKRRALPYVMASLILISLFTQEHHLSESAHHLAT